MQGVHLFCICHKIIENIVFIAMRGGSHVLRLKVYIAHNADEIYDHLVKWTILGLHSVL